MRRFAAWWTALACLLGARVATAAVTFEVHAPASTPADAVLWIAGDRAELGAWNGHGVALARGADGLWRATVSCAAGTSLQFKVTRGSWDTVEKDAHGGELANRTATAGEGADTVRVEVAMWRDQVAGAAAPRARVHTRTGDIREHPAFPSRLVSARDVLVWLPPGYAAETHRRYPVVYLLDGQNMFDGATSFLPGLEWRADEAADTLVRAGLLAPCVLVAVANSPRRMDEYTMVADPRNGGGKGEAHQRFLIEELKPFIDRTYRTRPDPAHTAIVGSSLGGLAALDLALDHPEVFGLAGAVSASGWWGDGAQVARIRAGHGHHARIWLDVGTAEFTPDDRGHAPRIGQSRELRDALLARGYTLERDLRYVEVPGARHDEAAWAARIGDILRWLIGPPEAR